MLLEHYITDRAADSATLVSGASTILGLTIGELNQYLQAGAFCVAIVSGICAAYYYICKARK